MDSKQNGVTLVKVSKEEKSMARNKKAEEKKMKQERVPEQDCILKKQYQITILKTVVLFIAALIVLGLMAGKVLSSGSGIFCILILAVVSTVITRGNK